MDKESQAKAAMEEQNVKVSKRWLDAIETCTFHGRNAADIASLVGYLKQEHESAKKRLDSALEALGSALKPEFGREAVAK